MAFELIHTGGPYGDCCSAYDVTLDREYTVEEFVEEVLKTKPGEWGPITIATDLKHTFTSKVDECEYKDGKITRDFARPGSRAMKISEVKAHGGWSLMNYFIKPKK